MNELKYKLPKGYLSFTQMNTYLYDPQEYYKQYILGQDFMKELRLKDINRWEKIKLGGIFQEAWYDPRINWKKKLRELGFTSDKERIISTALADPKLIRMAPAKCEKEYRARYKCVPILIKVDGYDEGKKLLLENKFGSPRGQGQVDDDLQISFYNLGLELALGKKPKKNIMQSVNDRSGKVEQIETIRTSEDLGHVGELILMAAKGISEGIWEK